jgi:threonylcarbamoyladenosine tRNA methylthiotransferase MtaB
MKGSISFHTLGCRLNQSETASLQNSFEASGYQVVDFEQDSDIVVINTCTVTEGGDADTRRLVHKVNRRNPGARIALVGCQAQIQKSQLAVLPQVRWIVGNQRKMDLVSVFNEFPYPATAEVIAPTIERQPFVMPVPAVARDHTRANVKIQDGCDFFCSFCEIPYARGRARSRIFEDVLIEARALVAAGHKEIILTGINIGTYAYETKGLLQLIGALEQLDGLARIRISSIEPTTIPGELFERMGHGKLCRYLHIPLQSGHNEILGLMKRKYTVEDFRRFIDDAFKRVQGLCIGTDVIVGFPGETDEHFQATADFLMDSPIHYFHIFSYSPRHVAQSRSLDGLPSQVISARSEVLRELGLRKRRLFHESQMGTEQILLLEECRSDRFSGLTDNYIRVQIPPGSENRKDLVRVRLTEAAAAHMLGERA